ncbi:Caleosin related protein-domain-containing protein [Hypoxylon sp. FL1284]|nr:Caleosin related protein-domain-containing protein [Hypoxylon sp. FL1284]
MSAKHTQVTRKPVPGHAEHVHPVKATPSVRHEDDHKSTQRVANHGHRAQKSIEAAVSRHANLGPGRRRMSVSAPDDNHVHDPRMHRAPASNGTARNNGAARNSKVPIPEKSERRAQRPVGKPKQVPPLLQPQPKGPTVLDSPKAAAVYEPGRVLRQNAEYFDVDQDGTVWPRDTLWMTGWGIASSSLATLAIHSALSYPTNPGRIPDLLLRIRYDASHHGHLHDYHSKKEINTPVQVCESILTKYDTSGKGGLNIRDVLRLWADQRTQSSVYGWCTSVIEWTTLYVVLWPRDGTMRSADLRAAFDGSILYRQAEERRRRVDAAKRQTVEAGRGGGLSGSVRLAVALVTGLAVLVWALGNLRGAEWWGKSD